MCFWPPMGTEAVEVYRRELGQVDLVILDLTMPRLNGRDACKELARIDPRVRVLLSSGFAPDAAGAVHEPGVRGFVAKPYRPGELAAAVQAALRSRATKSLVLASLTSCAGSP